MKTWMAGVSILCCAAVSWAAPTELAGIKIAPSVQVADAPALALNGAGLRFNGSTKITLTQVYAAKRFASVEEFLALPGPKRFIVTYLREFPDGIPYRHLSRSIQDNLPKNAQPLLIPSLMRLSDGLASIKRIAPGDQMTVDWIPGKGSVITMQGRQVTEPLPSPELFQGYAAMWMGSTPLDSSVKDALLGKE